MIAVPPSGLGQRYTQITTWLDENCGADEAAAALADADVLLTGAWRSGFPLAPKLRLLQVKGRSSPRRLRSGSWSARNGVKGPKRQQSLVACRLPALVFRGALTPEHAEGR
jgi:hypothetical protein